MPRPHPREFRDDVVAVARRSGAPVSQVARDFGISRVVPAELASCRRCRGWPPAGNDSGRIGRVRELKRRIRLLEQENEVLRRAAAYLSQANLRGE